MKLSQVIFCIGSNCGDRELQVDSSLEWLSERLSDFHHSHVYATPDCHGGARKYLNAVAIGFTGLSTDELVRICKERELACGRDDSARAAGDVPIDIDLVVYEREILREKDFVSEFFIKGYKELIDTYHVPSIEAYP